MASRSPIENVTLCFNDVDASDARMLFWRAPANVTISSMYLVTSTAIAAASANIMTVAVTNRDTDATGTNVVGTQTTDSDVSGYSAVTAKVAWAITNSSTASYLEVTSGQVLEAAITEGGAAGSGDMSDVSIVINYYVGEGS